MSPSNSTVRRVQTTDLDRCFAIESIAYEGDEAATREKIATRIMTWPQGFIVLEVDGVVAGFVNSGAAFEVQMSDEAFKELIGHDPQGPHVVIMSVVVHPDYQGQGFAKRLMSAFIEQMHDLGKASIHLMCQERLVPFYGAFGFIYSKPSESDHGGMVWHEMILDL
ncbi:GNAT family N-acetyltransferase [Pseudomonas gingeri]|uniref:GNAT family N-acetyltransferase n=1 Tax=Pseudomonas gingeri TaxID=117681 RepID=UPI0015A3F129|nr:GNAT family N-acetyltransferase [Pseudomonas gingeri]NWD06123.1 GNAT family N-acetyltransferase [Pseudomonas gingeri]NWE32735.1 GNAT family N-acetyltransferase [Pseudomonas gingeri]NWE55165.1 GNAT family N-acetyltransferase [Pseudomonas gingeri]NWF03219.1 GNAT family N-acetyltransferase [Pseudomonas gingeri]